MYYLAIFKVIYARCAVFECLFKTQSYTTHVQVF